MTQQEQPEEDHLVSGKIDCPLCGKIFENKATLKIHFYVHAPQFPTTQVISEEPMEIIKEKTDAMRPEDMLLVEVKEEEKGTISAKFPNDPEIITYQWADLGNPGPTEAGNVVKVHRNQPTLSKNDKIMCPLCEYQFVNKGLLKNHFISQHSLQKTINIEILPKRRTDLEEHTEMIEHTGIKEHTDIKEHTEIKEHIEMKEHTEIKENTEPKNLDSEVDGFEWEESIQHGLDVTETDQTDFTPAENSSVDDIKPEVSKFKWEDSVEVALDETGKVVKVHKKKISVSQNGMIECPRCGEEFQNKGELKTHFIKEHSIQNTNESKIQGQIEPENCNGNVVSSFKWKDSVKLELSETGSLAKNRKRKLRVSGIGNIKCPKCESVFHSKGGLKHHFIVKHALKCKDEQGDQEVQKLCKQNDWNPWNKGKFSKKPVELKCKYCNLMFFNEQELLEHIQGYRDKNGKYICRETGCDQKYSHGLGSGHWSNPLQIHMMKHRGEEKSLSCKTCGHMFYTEHSLNVHSKDHTSKGFFPCDQCGKIFDLLRNLKTHLRLHNTEGFSPCSQCPKLCSTREQLEKHMAVHNKRRRFGCTICEARFKEAFVAKRHLLTHETIKTIECEDCDKKFSTTNAKDGHVKRVHKKERRHPCSNCDQGFHQASKLRMHFKKMHDVPI